MYSFKNSLVCLLVIVSLVCFLICGCTQKNSTPEQTVEELQIALNSYDIERSLDCVSDDYAQLVRALWSVMVGEDSIDLQKWLGFLEVVIPAFPTISGGTIQKDDLPMIGLEVLHSEVNGDYAKAVVSGVVTLGGISYPFETTMEMKLEEERWVICGLDR